MCKFKAISHALLIILLCWLGASANARVFEDTNSVLGNKTFISDSGGSFGTQLKHIWCVWPGVCVG